MNNRGQVLVLFLLLLPILFMLTFLIIDNGNMYIEKRSLENEVKSAIKNHFKDEKIDIESYLKKIDKNVEIYISDNYIKIKIEKEISSVTSVFLKNNKTLRIVYVGTIDNDKLLIRKD